jgi:hypothetical protein
MWLVAAVLSERRKGFDWYVDSVNGSDSNTGKSPAQAFATIAKLMTVLDEGQTVGLACGSHWREQLSIAASNVSVLAYGSGNRPLLDCSNVIAAGAWSKTAGQTNVYQASVPLPGLGAGECYVAAWENNARLTRAANLGACDATPGSYYPSSDAVSPITLYVHPKDSTNPASDGKVYEYTSRRAALAAYDANGLLVNGIHTRRNLGIAGSLLGGRYCRVLNCLAEDGNSHNIFVRRGSLVDRCTVKGGYWKSSEVLLVGYDEEPLGEDLTFTNLVIEGNLSGGGVGVHTGTGTFGTVTLNNITVSNCAKANFQLSNTDQVVGTGLSGAGGTYGMNLNNVTDTHLIDCDLTATEGGVIISADGQALTARNLQIVSNDLGIYAPGNNVTIDLQDSDIDALNYCVRGDGTGFTLISRGNEFATGWQPYKIVDAGATLDSDYNHFAADRSIHVFGTEYPNLAAYKTATGQDAHSTIG